MKHTQWHKGNVKPVHIGVYKRRYWHYSYFCRWDGEVWYQAHETAESAALETMISGCQYIPWRGLTR